MFTYTEFPANHRVSIDRHTTTYKGLLFCPISNFNIIIQGNPIVKVNIPFDVDISIKNDPLR